MSYDDADDSAKDSDKKGGAKGKGGSKVCRQADPARAVASRLALGRAGRQGRAGCAGGEQAGPAGSGRGAAHLQRGKHRQHDEGDRCECRRAPRVFTALTSVGGRRACKMTSIPRAGVARVQRSHFRGPEPRACNALTSPGGAPRRLRRQQDAAREAQRAHDQGGLRGVPPAFRRPRPLTPPNRPSRDTGPEAHRRRDQRLLQGEPAAAVRRVLHAHPARLWFPQHVTVHDPHRQGGASVPSGPGAAASRDQAPPCAR